jgi:Fe-S cluster assembly protein SufD
MNARAAKQLSGNQGPHLALAGNALPEKIPALPQGMTLSAKNGVRLHVGKDAKCAQPLYLSFGKDASFTLEMEEGAKLLLIESHDGAGTGSYNCTLAKGAELDRFVIENAAEGETAAHSEVFALGANTRLSLNFIQTGDGALRRTLAVTHDGGGAQSTLRAVNFASGRGRIDFETEFRHRVENTGSSQNIRALADDKGRAAFLGNIIVAEGAQKTESAQTHHGLLLSDTAEIYTKPGLEIYADDVKCGHGATCGALDEAAIFYLRSRGIARGEAEKLLLQAFVTEIFDDMETQPAKDAMLAELAGLTGGAHVLRA